MATILPHDERNIVHISVWKNPQKLQKPHADASRRRETYWDLRGRFQEEYDRRLAALPDEGVADTVAGEIFRAATKIYYDFHNNAMVNNTSGALNFLASKGVIIPATKPPADPCDIFRTIYPYTTGAAIHFGELDVLYAVESLVDRTLAYLREHPALDGTPNVADYHRLRDRDDRSCMERCAIRNRRAADLDAAAAAWAAKMEGTQRRGCGVGGGGGGSGKKKGKNKAGAKKKAQDHHRHARTPPGGKGGGSSPSEASQEKENNGKKWRKHGGRGKKKKKASPTSVDKSAQGRDLSAKFAKLGLCN